MIPTISKSSNKKDIVINTGNIINIGSELARKPSDEILEGLKATLTYTNYFETKDNDSGGGGGNGDGLFRSATDGHSDNNKKFIETDERNDISIAAKIFLNRHCNTCIKKAIEAVLQVLDVTHLDNVVLAYHPNARPVTKATEVTPTQKSPCADNPGIDDDDNGSQAAIRQDWSKRNGEKGIKELKDLYKNLEELSQNKKIIDLGIADLDASSLSQLYYEADVQPTIAQINIASCCVVPPTLQEYCNKNDIRLLTHADPELILPKEKFAELVPDYTVDWIVRYQVHLRCRGVLTARGYIIGGTIDDNKMQTATTTTKTTGDDA